MKKSIFNIGRILAVFVVITMISALLLPAAYAEDAENVPENSTVFALTGDWVKYEPCSELVIDAFDLDSTVIVVKGTGKNPDIVWSLSELSDDEHDIVADSMKGVPGSGNPKSYEFISGEGAGAYGMSVNIEEGKIVFEKPSNWALIFGGGFTRIEADNTREETGTDSGTDVSEGAEADVTEEIEEIHETPGDAGQERKDGEGIFDGPVDFPEEDAPEESPDIPGPGTDVTEEPKKEVSDKPEAEIAEASGPVYTPVRAELISADYIMVSENIPVYIEESEEECAEEPAQISEPPAHVLDIQPRTSVSTERYIRAGIALICIAMITVLCSTCRKETSEEK